MRLGVNVDHIATLRQARKTSNPDPKDAARICEQAGASSIVCHLREDRRHIQDTDVWRLRQSITTRLNLEMSIAKEIVAIALAVKPAQVTLVPERRQELTTEGGLDIVSLRGRLKRVVRAFQERGIEVSLFVDPVVRQLQAAQDLGVEMIELHTGRYAEASAPRLRLHRLRQLSKAAQAARKRDLSVAAGHGLDYDNVSAVVEIPEIEELNIGYAIIRRALFVGLQDAVREMVGLVSVPS